MWIAGNKRITNCFVSLYRKLLRRTALHLQALFSHNYIYSLYSIDKNVSKINNSL